MVYTIIKLFFSLFLNYTIILFGNHMVEFLSKFCKGMIVSLTFRQFFITQCGKWRIFLVLRFSVNSILANLKVSKTIILTFFRFWKLILVNFSSWKLFNSLKMERAEPAKILISRKIWVAEKDSNLCQNLSATHLLREINLDKFKVSKAAILTILQVLNFDI